MYKVRCFSVLVLVTLAILFNYGYSYASEKVVVEQVDAKQMKGNPELGFAPLPIKFGETVGLFAIIKINRLKSAKLNQW